MRRISKNFVLAVAVLHAKGLVHLDIKPENMMKALIDENSEKSEKTKSDEKPEKKDEKSAQPSQAPRIGTWRLIDVDGCTHINTSISINDSSISFSPCYCAPEWAHFLIEDSDTLRVADQLDVWSVGISLCELILLDAVLKPR